MPVNTTHPDYDHYFGLWAKTRAAANSSVDQSDIYLPADFKDDTERYKVYRERAYFLGVTGRTEKSMVGMVFRKPADYELPAGIEYLLEDFDGSGNSAEQAAKAALTNLLETKRHLFLVDYPKAEEGITAAQERELGLRPTIASYAAENLINWRFEGIRGKRQLVLAVLQESQNQSTDEFGHDYRTVYRVLRLTDGVYTQQLYNHNYQAISDEYSPRMAGGGTFDHIPLHGVRELENPPLLDIAKVNIAHYRNIADLEDSAYVVGQPTVHLDVGDTGLEEWAERNTEGVKFGSRTGLITRKGKLEIAQASENNLVRQIKMDKEQEMIMLGAQLITRGGQAETAEAARINASAEASVLDTLVNDLSEDIEAAFEDAALFAGEQIETVEYSLNTDYWETGLSPQAFMAIVQGYTNRLYAQSDALNMIREGRIAIDPDRTNENISGDIAGALLDDSIPSQDDLA